MNKFKTSLLIVVILFSTTCKKSKTDNTGRNAVILAALSSRGTTTASSSSCSSGTSTGSTITNPTATLDATTDCVTGVTTCMDSALPSWIKDNFKCAIGYVSGTSYVFKSQNLPNTKSSYYGSTSPLFEARTLTGTNPNTTASQKLVYTIPSTPTRGTGTDSTQGGLASIGITLNGLAIFNNAAAPGDTLATEAATFDNFAGHPQNTGVYHHHAAVPKVSNNNNTNSNNSKLIGIILDGYAIYGKLCDNGTATTADDTTPTLDALHGHTSTTIHFSTPTYHYHFAADPTATIDTLMGSFFYGTKGTVTN